MHSLMLNWHVSPVINSPLKKYFGLPADQFMNIELNTYLPTYLPTTFVSMHSNTTAIVRLFFIIEVIL